MRDLSSQNVLPDALTPYADVDRRLVDGRRWVLANMVSGLDGIAVHFPTVDDVDIATTFGTLTGDRDDKFARCTW